MNIKLRTRYAGPSGNYAPDTVIDLPGKEAKALVNAGCAEDVSIKIISEKKVETATAKRYKKATEV